MNRNQYRWLEEAALTESPTTYPQLTWGHVLMINGATVVMAADGYRIHALYDESMKHLRGHSFPFSFSQAFDRIRTVDNLAEHLNQADSFDIRYTLATQPLKRLLRAMEYTEVHGVWLISLNSRLYILHDYGLTALGQGENVSDGLRMIDPYYLWEAFKGLPDSIVMSWQSGTLSPLAVGVRQQQMAVIMPIDESRFDTDAVWKRVVILTDALLKADEIR